MNRPQIAHLLLRVGVALSFLFPPIAAIFDPISWISYFPSFVRHLPVDATVLLHVFGVVEVVLALWILSGYKIRIPAAVATLMLIAIVGFNWADFQVLFRDVSIACMSLALVFWPRATTASLSAHV